MTVKIVKVRSLTTSPCAYSNTVDDGYFRYVTVDGKRGVQIKARTLADLKRKIADHYQN
jgi:hypothetical protein